MPPRLVQVESRVTPVCEYVGAYVHSIRGIIIYIYIYKTISQLVDLGSIDGIGPYNQAIMLNRYLWNDQENVEYILNNKIFVWIRHYDGY